MEVKSDESRFDSALTVVFPLAIIYGLFWLIYGSDIDTPFRWLMFFLSPLFVVVVGILSYLPVVGIFSLAMYTEKKKEEYRARLDREVETFMECGDLELAHRLACIARDKAKADFDSWINAEPSLFERWLNGKKHKKPGWFRALGLRARRYQQAYQDRLYVADKVRQAIIRQQLNRQFS
jgi:hypothetical protein